MRGFCSPPMAQMMANPMDTVYSHVRMALSRTVSVPRYQSGEVLLLPALLHN